MKNKIFILICSALLIANLLYAAEDPFESEKDIPAHHYDMYRPNNKPDIEKECGLPDFNSESLDIFQAVTLTLCRNPETKTSWLAIKRQAADYGITTSEYLPSFTVSSSHNQSRTKPPDIENKNTSEEISFDWLIFDFGRRKANNDKASLVLLQSNYLHNDLIQNVVYMTIRAYCNLFSSKKGVDAAISSEETYKTAYEIAEEKYRLGIVPKADVLKAKTEYAQSSLDRMKAENTEADYQGQLLKLLNAKQGTQIRLKEPQMVNRFTDTEKNIEELIKKALENRNNIKALESQEKSYKAAEKSAALTGFPTISLYGNTGITDRHDGSENLKNNMIGLQFSLPVFTGFEKTYNLKKALYNSNIAELEKEKAKNEVAYEVWAAYNNLKISGKTFEVSGRMLESASENKNLTLGMYKSGQCGMLELLKAAASYAEAQKERIESEYNGFIAQASLLKAIGELDTELINKKRNRNENIRK